MYRFRREGVSVITVLDTRHQKKSGLYPVKIEVIFKRRHSIRLETRLGHAGQNGKINTFYRYRSTLRALERFSGKSISFELITVSWLSRCERFWLMEGKTSTTVNIFMRSLKCIFTEAYLGRYDKEERIPGINQPPASIEGGG